MKTRCAIKKVGRRTATLKELAQRNFSATPKELEEENHQLSEANLEDDKLDNQVSLTSPIHQLNKLIKKEISRSAKALNIEEVELQAWIDLQVKIPKKSVLALLRIAIERHLDPLKEEIAFANNDNSEWKAFITLKGYYKILNAHPAFDGITFTQAGTNSNEIPAWMECTIYRKDRSHPIKIPEYFDEVKGEQTIWQKMPRRMLRHRLIQQCAKLALG